jgi:hypothetical protein
MVMARYPLARKFLIPAGERAGGVTFFGGVLDVEKIAVEDSRRVHVSAAERRRERAV